MKLSICIFFICFVLNAKQLIMMLNEYVISLNIYLQTGSPSHHNHHHQYPTSKTPSKQTKSDAVQSSTKPTLTSSPPNPSVDVIANPPRKGKKQ
jgi:hypothetical protein